MRLKEIVDEGIIDNLKKGYDTGYQAVDTLMTPTKWFQKSNQPSGNKNQTVELPKYQTRDVLTRTASSEKLYRQDIENLKIIHSKVKDGSIPVNDPQTVLKTIELAYTGKPLSKEQAELMATLAKRF